MSLSPQASSRPLQPFLKLVDLHLSGHTCGRGPAARSTENTRTEISCAVAISASLSEQRFVVQRTLTHPFGSVLCPPNRDSEHEAVLSSRKCFQNNLFPRQSLAKTEVLKPKVQLQLYYTPLAETKTANAYDNCKAYPADCGGDDELFF